MGVYPLLINQIIFCGAFSVQCLIKRTIADHLHYLQQAIMLHILLHLDYTLFMEYKVCGEGTRAATAAISYVKTKGRGEKK